MSAARSPSWGARLIDGVAKKTADQFFTSFANAVKAG